MVGCYGAGCGDGAYDISLYHKIMVKFRPIAPKPVTGSESGAGGMNNNIHLRKFKAKKRRYVRLNSKNTKRSIVSEEDKKTETSTESSSEVENKKEEEKEKEKEVVTLSLMPETPDPKQTLPPFNQDLMITFPQKLLTPMRNPFSYFSSDGGGGGGASDLVGTTVGSSYVIVESVTDTCEDAKRLLGSTDEERWMNLYRDTCPGFISDAHNNQVRWTNEAYRLLVGQAPPEMVWLVTKRRLPPIIMDNHHQGFGCRVKLQYTWKNERKSMVVPCDVWRINGGDLAWRLDVLSALSLGR